jgi:hypothetical protein
VAGILMRASRETGRPSEADARAWQFGAPLPDSVLLPAIESAAPPNHDKGSMLVPSTGWALRGVLAPKGRMQ